MINDTIKKWASIVAITVLCIYDAIVWAPPTDKELAWFLVPTLSLIGIVGGTWWKASRRFIAPAITAYALWSMAGVQWYWLIAVAASLGIWASLPMTLKGDSIPGNWINWAWVWVLGLLAGGIVTLIGFILKMVALSLFLAILPFVVIGLFTTLSNIKATANYFRWKFCELAFWTSIGVPIAYLISQ